MTRIDDVQAMERRLLAALDERLEQVRRDMIDEFETLSDTLNQPPVSNASFSTDIAPPPAPDDIFPDLGGFGDTIQRGVASTATAALSGREINPQRLARPLLHQTGRSLGQDIGQRLFDREGEGMRLGGVQLAAQWLGVLGQGSRNR